MIFIDVEISRSKTVSTFRVKQPADCLPPLPATTLRSGEVPSRLIFWTCKKITMDKRKKKQIFRQVHPRTVTCGRPTSRPLHQVVVVVVVVVVVHQVGGIFGVIAIDIDIIIAIVIIVVTIIIMIVNITT